MEVKLGNQRFKVYAMDFETHNDEESLAKNETSIWLSCLIDETSTPQSDCFDYDMDSVLERLERLSKEDNLLVYIYNLSFEWSFILPVIISKGFVWKADIEKGDCYCFTSVSTKTATSVWQAELRFGPKSKRVVFRDLSKLYGGGLGKLAKDMGIPTQKGEIDYTLNRLHGHIVTDEERFYCFKDCRIVVEVLQKQLGDKDFWLSVSAASYSMRHMIRAGYPRAKNPYSIFRQDYPVLGKEEEEFVRHAVSGGISYATPRYQFLEINQRLVHIDGRQMHPSSAYLNKFPFGYGRYGRGKPKESPYFISCCHVKVSYDYVKLHSVIKLIGTPFVTGYELWLWDFEIPTFLKAYGNAKVEYIDYYRYVSRYLPWKEFYNENFEGREKEKALGHSDLALRYKLLNNSSYGKLIEHGHQYDRENYIAEDGTIDSIDHENLDRPADGKYTYVPVGACIPAYSRVRLIETALLFGWENVVYFDTDTIVAVDCPKTQEVLKTLDFGVHLGAWGREADIIHAQFAAPKRYKAYEDGKGLVVHCAGFQVKTKLKVGEDENGDDITKDVPFEEINIVSSEWQVQRAYRARGGTLIRFQTKRMEVQPKYKDLANSNLGAKI